MRNVLFLVVSLSLIALIILYFTPVNRSFNFKFMVQATPAYVYDELLQTSEWNKWYFFKSRENQNNLVLQPLKQDEIVAFTIADQGDKNSKGTFHINLGLDGGSILSWKDTVHFSKGLVGKLQLILWPSSYSNKLIVSINRLRANLEIPAEVEAGVRFKIYQMKGHVIAAINDTISSGKLDQKIIELYQKIRNQFKPETFTDTSRMMSRFKLLGDSSINLEVGLRMKDALMKIPAPMIRLEVPTIPIVVASAKTNYQQSRELIEITHDWVKKFNLKLASPSWFEQSIKFQNGKYQIGDTLRIIQPFYYWLRPIQDYY
ncbi:MAG: hypothetical protein NVS9B7_28260 [Flavisolibacter sp.]